MKRAAAYPALLLLSALLSGIACSFPRESFVLPPNEAADSYNVKEADDASTNLNVVMIPLGGNGDSTLLDYGDTEILIDAGGVSDSATKIVNVINEYVTDGKLEMIIITHSDNDHLVSFAGQKGVADWLQLKGTCDYLIDFDLTKDNSVKFPFKSNFFDKEKDTTTDEGDEDETPNKDVLTPYSNYVLRRDQLVLQKRISHYLTASECTYQERGVDPSSLREEASSTAKSLFSFDASGKETASSDSSLDIRILYNYFYDHPLSDDYDENHKPSSCELNIISVCTLASLKREKFLFTGDLSEYNSAASYAKVGGESKLLEYNEEYLDEGVLFYKAAHHGSMTSNSDKLLNVIRPQYVGIECCASTSGFAFPKDTVIRSFLNWTDYIYLTEKSDDDGNPTEYHGKVVLSYNPQEEQVKVSYSNEEAPASILDSDWMYQNKNLSCNIINLSQGNENVLEAECTYIKIGHFDILVNCGGYTGISGNLPNNPVFLDKIEHYCNDRVLDLIIISGCATTNISDLVGNAKTKTGLLYNPNGYFKKIGTIVVNSDIFGLDGDLYSNLNEVIQSGVNSGFIGKYQDGKTLPGLSMSLRSSDTFSISIQFLMCNNGINGSSLDIGSIPFVISCNDIDYMNLGRLTDEYDEFGSLFDNNSAFFESHTIDVMTLPKFGRTSTSLGEETKIRLNKIISLSSQSDGTGTILLIPGSYGAKNQDGQYLYPSELFISDSYYKRMGYASCFASRSLTQDKEGDLMVVCLFKDNQATRKSIRSQAKDELEYSNISKYESARADLAYSLLNN